MVKEVKCDEASSIYNECVGLISEVEMDGIIDSDRY